MDEKQKREIRKFLVEFKKIASRGRDLDFIYRKEYKTALLELGLTNKDRKNAIMTLSVADYCNGPIPDRDRPGHLWIFGKHIGYREVYIKLKIAQVGNRKIAKCISFHAASHPLCFPYKEKDKKGG